MPDHGNDPSLPSWHQVVALGFSYRRLLLALVSAPTISVVVPLVLNLAYLIFDRFTNNHTLLSFVLTFLVTPLIQNSIRNAAPDAKSAEKAVRRTTFWLPFILFILFAVAAQVVVTPLGDVLGIKDYLTWSPSVSISCSFRLAIGTFFLGLTVVLRYAGPHSVVRCSSSPLIEHPFVTGAQTLRSKISLDAVIDFLFVPSEMPGDLYKTPFSTPTVVSNARRLRYPTFRDAVVQIVISGIGATAFAFASVLPYSPQGMHGDSSDKSILILSSMLAVWAHLYGTALGGDSHELSPLRYHRSQWTKHRNIMYRAFRMGKSLFFAATVVPVAAMLMSWVLMNNDTGAGDGTFWAVILACSLSATFVSLYLHIFDEVLRIKLCAPLSSIQKVVHEISEDDRTEVFLDVTMHSILHSDSSLVRSLSGSVEPFARNLEARELAQNEKAAKSIAKILLHKSAGDESTARLEEDILRLHVLESLGGTSWNGRSSDGLEKAGASHIENLKYWIQPQDNLNIGHVRVEPLVVPLVRALCAYVGGMGEALLICAGQKMPATLNPWLLPPGAIICTEYALRAASRCLLFNLSHSAQILSDWRSTHLSMLIPVLISSSCRLEHGILKFIQARKGIKDIPLEKFDFVRSESPELLPLFYECNDSVVAVLQKLKSLEGVRRIDFDLDPVCRKWMEGIMTKYV